MTTDALGSTQLTIMWQMPSAARLVCHGRFAFALGADENGWAGVPMSGDAARHGRAPRQLMNGAVSSVTFNISVRWLRRFSDHADIHKYVEEFEA